MWAMIPMLRVRSSDWLRLGVIVQLSRSTGATTGSYPCSSWEALPDGGRAPRRSGGLPAVGGEGLVRLSHLVHVVLALDRTADAVVGIEQLGGQPLGHRALTPVAGEAHEPADGQRGGPARPDLDGNL